MRVAVGHNYLATGTIQDVMSSMRTETHDGETKTIAGVLRRAAGNTEVENFEKMVKNAIKEYLLKTNYDDKDNYAKDENVEKIYHYNKNNDKIKVTVAILYNTGEDPRPNSEYKGMGYYYTLGFTNSAKAIVESLADGDSTTTEEQDIKKAISATYDEEDKVDTGTYDATENGTVETETDAQGNQKKDQEEDQADIGGILLSPVFYLVNFIADAITSNLERIMIGDDASFSNVTGTGVLQLNEIKPEDLEEKDLEKKYHIYEVNMDELNMIGTVQYPNIQYTPEAIFSGVIDLLSIDFISGKVPKTDEDGNVEYEENSNDGWKNVRNVISQWYKVLRMIAIIGLLSVLIYTGIKIIISANAKDKAKYKEWIINWFMAVAILFAMHLIMAFIIAVTGELSALINESSQKILIVNGDDKSVTNLMGLVRFMIQSEDFYMKVGYEVMYIALLVYTIKFTVVYLKRVLNMAFLTLIAPIVALTYPLDKINDGRAQGFDMWLKEYIFNALLQPMHQIMYYILVGSAVSIAASNPLYGIVVLAFMTEAEKLLKKIFGFDKAGGGTVGGMTGAFAAGAIASNIKNIAKLAGGKGGNGGNSSAEENNALEAAKPTRKDPGSSFFGNAALEDGNQQQGSGNAEEESESRMTDSQQNQTDSTQDDDLAQERQRLDSERNVLDQFRDEAMSDNSNFEVKDYKELIRMDKEQREKEEKLRQREEQRKNATQTSGSGQGQGQAQSPNSGAGTDSGSDTGSASQQPNTKPIHKLKNGTKSVLKSLAKPVWDFDKSGKYNGKRLTRKIAKGVIGAGIGITAAAVQAGISITDGKYNPMEGMATFAAGMAGGGQIVNRAENMGNTFMDGYTSGDKEAKMKRAQEAFRNNDKVIAHYKREYGDNWKKQLERAKDNYVTQGIKDTGEQKRCIKFANEMKDKYNWTDEQADKYAGDTLDFRNTLKEQGQLGAVNDLQKRKKYIESICEGKDEAEKKKLREQYNRAFDAVMLYNDIVY